MTSLEDLVSMERTELDGLFEEAETPEPDELEGDASGALLAGRGIFEVSTIRRLLNTPINPWRGKTFDGDRGKNLVGYSPLSTEIFEFEGEIRESLVDEDDVLTLNYDQDSNPAIARRVRDDVRRVDDDLYLVSTNFEAMNGYRFVGYYGLDTSEES